MTQSDTTSLEAIVLAAGRGVRFGGGKLVAPFNGAPLIAGALLTAFLAPVRRVFVAVGPDPAVRKAVETTAARLAAAERLVLVSVERRGRGRFVANRRSGAAE
jgi:molybdenum cofactor cytidylyltransferase